MQFDHLKRREFIALLGGAAVARPGAAISQLAQPARRIGVLMGTSEGDAEVHPYLLTFQKALQTWAGRRTATSKSTIALSCRIPNVLGPPRPNYSV